MEANHAMNSERKRRPKFDRKWYDMKRIVNDVSIKWYFRWKVKLYDWISMLPLFDARFIFYVWMEYVCVYKYVHKNYKNATSHN